MHVEPATQSTLVEQVPSMAVVPARMHWKTIATVLMTQLYPAPQPHCGAGPHMLLLVPKAQHVPPMQDPGELQA
jgi:hypothetical protein